VVTLIEEDGEDNPDVVTGELLTGVDELERFCKRCEDPMGDWVSTIKVLENEDGDDVDIDVDGDDILFPWIGIEVIVEYEYCRLFYFSLTFFVVIYKKVKKK